MISRLFAVPVNSDTDGFLTHLKELVEDYKQHMLTNVNIFHKITKWSLYKRINDMIKYRHNFGFNESQSAIYADLVIQFENINKAHSIEWDNNYDSKTSLLGEVA